MTVIIGSGIETGLVSVCQVSLAVSLKLSQQALMYTKSPPRKMGFDTGATQACQMTYHIS